jgi:hypothetical protein
MKQKIGLKTVLIFSLAVNLALALFLWDREVFLESDYQAKAKLAEEKSNARHVVLERRFELQKLKIRRAAVATRKIQTKRLKKKITALQTRLSKRAASAPVTHQNSALSAVKNGHLAGSSAIPKRVKALLLQFKLRSERDDEDGEGEDGEELDEEQMRRALLKQLLPLMGQSSEVFKGLFDVFTDPEQEAHHELAVDVFQTLLELTGGDHGLNESILQFARDNSRDPGLRTRVLESLRLEGRGPLQKASLDLLLALSQDTSIELREAAVGKLGELDDAEIKNELSRIARNLEEDAGVRSVAIYGMRIDDEQETIDFLLTTTQHKDPELRRAALTRFHDIEFGNGVLNQFHDQIKAESDPEIVETLLELIGQRGSAESVPVLSRLGKDEKRPLYLRNYAAEMAEQLSSRLEDQKREREEQAEEENKGGAGD